MIKEVLSGLGLTNNEIEIYLTLLKAGPISVNKIGEKSGLHRQVCYDALERLLEKGFVSYFIQNNKKHFQALDPQNILHYLDEKKESVRNIIPKLLKLTTLSREETFVEVYKGKQIIRIILRDVISTLKEKGGHLMMLGVEETRFMEQDRIAIQQYLRDLKKFKLKEKLIAQEGAKLYFSGEQSEYRLIEKEYFNPNPTYIYAGKVVQIIWGNPNHAIMITHSEIYDSYKKWFLMLWKLARRIPRQTKKSR
jgi:sugar-specific transcriptional regulator TrmB